MSDLTCLSLVPSGFYKEYVQNLMNNPQFHTKEGFLMKDSILWYMLMYLLRLSCFAHFSPKKFCRFQLLFYFRDISLVVFCFLVKQRNLTLLSRLCQVQIREQFLHPDLLDSLLNRNILEIKRCVTVLIYITNNLHFWHCLFVSLCSNCYS